MSDPLQSLKRLKYEPKPGRWEALAAQPPPRRVRLSRVGPALLAAAAALLLAVWARGPRFETVVTAQGTSRTTSLTSGWFETGAGESATVQIADIGQVRVEPESRLRLVESGKTKHRLELTRGVLHASVDAPPRLFVVDTPQATAVDLGCAYTLRVTENGTELTVESGLVALEGLGRVSVVLEGMRARTRPHSAPTTPLSLEASPALVEAVERFDRRDDARALLGISISAHATDAATLWHVIQRAPSPERELLIARLETFVPAPPSRSMEDWWEAIVAAH